MREEWLDEAKGICTKGLDELKKLYTPFSLTAKGKNGKEYGDYYVPWITMFPNHKEKIGKEVELMLTLPFDYIDNDLDSENEKFTLQPTNPNIRVEPNIFSIADAMNPVKITIYCDAPLQEDASIEVKSSTKHLVGKLNIMKNADYENYTINIPVVFSYLIDKDLPFNREVIENEIQKIGGLQAIEDYLNKQSLNQALIQVKLDIENVHDWGFSKNSLKVANAGKNPRNGKGKDEHEYNYMQFEELIVDESKMKVDAGKMLNFFHHQFGLKETALVNKKGDIILYLTSLSAEEAGGGAFIVPLDNKDCIIFKQNLDVYSSYAHEVAHTLGLDHSFVNEIHQEKDKFLKPYEDSKNNIIASLNKYKDVRKDHPVIKYLNSNLANITKTIEGYKVVLERNKYGFTKNSTDNIMDYNIKKRNSFMKFQWEIMQEETKKYYN